MKESLDEPIPKFKVNDKVRITIDGTSQIVRIIDVLQDTNNDTIWYEIKGYEGTLYDESAFDLIGVNDDE